MLLNRLILGKVNATAVGAFSLISGVLAQRDIELRSAPLVGLAHFAIQTKPNALAIVGLNLNDNIHIVNYK